MEQVSLTTETRDKNGLPFLQTITYPNIIRDPDPFMDINDITQVKIVETPHFVETGFFNSKNEMINLEKIPWGCFFTINIASKKVIALSIKDTVESERNNWT